jgi:chromate reductase, NAD(P)H dehydrogenase (quinone)
MINILGISGSLRPTSSSRAVLNEMKDALPSSAELLIYDRIGKIPHFDESSEDHPEVSAFRAAVRNSHAVVICTPEYAFGIPGSLKNALDWTVGSGDFVNKPVALITASGYGDKGHAAMLLVLQAISANVLPEATFLIPFIRAKLDDRGKIKDAETKQRLDTSIREILSQFS